jgi:hypothetical protein
MNRCVESYNKYYEDMVQDAKENVDRWMRWGTTVADVMDDAKYWEYERCSAAFYYLADRYRCERTHHHMFIRTSMLKLMRQKPRTPSGYSYIH